MVEPLNLKEEPLSSRRIQQSLETALVGRRVCYFPVVESTNALAVELALGGWPEGTMVVADFQTGGRGRQGRAWYAPAGKSLLVSFLFRPGFKVRQAFRLSLAACLAVARTVEKVAGLSAGIEWQNDVIIREKKAAGILVELGLEEGLIDYAVLGVGLNVAFDPEESPELAGKATSLLKETGKAYSRLELLARLSLEMERNYLALKRDGYPDIHKEWRSRLQGLGQKVHIHTREGPQEGIAQDVDEEGALVLGLASGKEVKIIAEELA